MHEKLENLLGRMGVYLYENPLKVIVVVLLFLAFPLFHVPQIKMDTSVEGFLHKDDPLLLEYNAFRAQFGRDERIVIALKSDDIFTLKFLKTLRTMHEDLETNLPFIDDITSLYNVRNTRGVGDKLVTDDLLQSFPETQKQVEVIKKQALASHFYKDLFLSSDGKMTTIIIETDAYSHKDEKKVAGEDALDEGSAHEKVAQAEKNTEKTFLSDKENAEILEAVSAIMHKYKQDGIKMHIAGSPSLNHALELQMKKGMQEFMRIAFFVIVIFLFIMFRRISAVLYPLIVIVLSLLVVVGMMAWSGVAFKLPTQILPLFLLTVGIGATVHLLSLFFDKFNATGNKKDAIRYALGHSGLAIVMTSVATAIGVGSFAGSDVAPISDLGIFASLGVMVSLFLTLALLPALLSVTKLKPRMTLGADKLDRMLKKLSIIPIKYYKSIIITSAILVAIALVGATKIHLSHNPLNWFPPESYERISADIIDEKLNGSVSIELMVDTKKENGWNDPVRLEKLNKLSANLEKYVDIYTHAGKVISLATIVKETNRALHENKEEYYSIPSDADLISQEFLLFENSGSDDLEDVVDSGFSQARITIKLPLADAVKAMDLLTYVEEEASKTFPNDVVVSTGMFPLLIHTFEHAVSSFISRYFTAFISITFVMMFILGTFRLGLISMIPILLPILFGLFMIYVANIPLDMFMLLIGFIAIGLCVDYTIHFMHHFKKYYIQSRDSSWATEQTFYTTGKAMVIVAIVLSLGFYAYMMADMIPVQNFGLLTGSVVLLALLCDLLLAPALMIVISKRGWIR